MRFEGAPGACLSALELPELGGDAIAMAASAPGKLLLELGVDVTASIWGLGLQLVWRRGAQILARNWESWVRGCSMRVQDATGYAATVVASTSMMPQLYKVWRTRSAGDVSYGAVGMIMLASSLWHAHGWIKRDTPLRVSSAITLCVVGMLAVLKFRFDSAKAKAR